MACLLAALLLAAPGPLQASFALDQNYGYDPNLGATVETSVLSGRFAAASVIEGATATLGYVPRLTLSNATAAHQTGATFFNTGSLGLEMARDTTLLRLTEALGGGQQDFSVLAQSLAADPRAPSTPSVDRLPSQRFVPTFSTGTTMLVQQLFTRRWTFVATASFTSGGGLGHEGRALLPLQRTSTGELRLAFRLSPEDELAAAASGSLSASSSGGKSTAANLLASWRKKLAPATTGSVALGIAFVDNYALASAGSTALVSTAGAQVVPTAHVTLNQVVPLSVGVLTLGADGVAQTAIDPLSGGGYLRGNARLDCAWAVTPELSLGAAALGDRVLSGELSGAFGGAGELSAALRTSRRLSLRLAFRAALLTPTHLLLPEEDPLHQWSVVAGVAGEL